MIVTGDNVVVYIFDGGVWKLYVCASSCELNVSTEIVETSVSGNGLWASFLPTKNSFTVTLSGVVSLNVTGALTLPELRQKQVTHQALLMRFQRTDLAENVYADEATFFITNSTDTGAYDGINTFNITGQGTGAITQIFTPTVPVPVGSSLVYRYEYTASGSETGFTDSVLANKTILEVNTDGLGTQIIYSGTPVGNEVKYIVGTGQLIWAIPFESGQEIYILYQ